MILSGLRVAERAKRWHLWLDRWTNRLVRWNVCVSEGVRQFSARAGGLAEDKLCVIPNGVDAERFATARPADLGPFGIPPGAWTAVTVGRLWAQKGHADLVQAVAPLLRETPRLHLLIVGEGPERGQLTQLVTAQRITSQVHLPGWQGEVPGILRSCQLFVLPSRWEGMPNVLLEALAAGLPVVATDVEGVRELLGGGEAENLVPPGDLEALSMAIKRAYENVAGPAGNSSQHITLKSHAWNHVSLAYENLFRECQE